MLDSGHRKTVEVTESGHRVGETHHRARHSDAMVRYLRDLHELHGMPPTAIADFTGQPIRWVKSVIYFERRLPGFRLKKEVRDDGK